MVKYQFSEALHICLAYSYITLDVQKFTNGDTKFLLPAFLVPVASSVALMRRCIAIAFTFQNTAMSPNIPFKHSLLNGHGQIHARVNTTVQVIGTGGSPGWR